jgi:hypothetical protein
MFGPISRPGSTPAPVVNHQPVLTWDQVTAGNLPDNWWQSPTSPREPEGSLLRHPINEAPTVSSTDSERFLLDAPSVARSTSKPGGPAHNARDQEDLGGTTINYGKDVAKVGAQLGVTGLKTRKPHKKRGTGSSGTDHSRADANAAKAADSKVRDAIEKKTGVRQSPAQFLSEQEKKQSAATQRSEKADQARAAERERIEEHNRDFRNWIAHLAPQEWREAESAKGNEYPKPAGKKNKLEKQATENQWPTKWNPSYAKYLYD